MNAYIAQIKMSLRLTFRNRMALAFSYGFPLVFFFLFGTMSGAGGGRGAGQIVAMVLSMGVLGTGFFGAGLQSVMNREQNILRRFKVAPITPAPILVAVMVGGLVHYIPMSLLILFLANRRYSMPWPEEFVSLMVFIALGVITFCALGSIVAAVVNSMQEASLVTNLFYLPMLLLSGSTIPISVMPGWVQTVSQFLPSAHFMGGMQSMMRGRETLADNLPAIGALLLTTAVASLLSIKLFRWEKEEKLRPQAKLWLVAVFAPFLVMGAYQAYAKTNIERAKLLDRDVARGRTWLIHDARIFVGDGKVIERGSVLVREGKIERVFEGDAPEAKQLNATAIEGAGKTLMPGLIDSAVRLDQTGLLDPSEKADVDRELAAYLYSGVTAVRNYGPLATPNPTKLGAEVFSAPQGAPQSVGLAAIEAGVMLREHKAAPLERSLVQQVAAPVAIRKAKDQMLAVEAPAEPEKLKSAKKALQESFEDDVPLVAVSRGGSPFMVHGPGIHRELQLWVQTGVPAAQALQAVTGNAARALGVEKRIGFIQPGAEATLLLVDGNPLEEIAATERISTVLFKGERVNRGALFEQK